MAAKSSAEIVARWFAERMATGELSRDQAAHGQAITAKDDLVKRLDAAKGAESSAVEEWFGKTIATGAIARNTVAYNQAFTAKSDLIARLSDANGARPATPTPSKAGTRAASPRPRLASKPTKPPAELAPETKPASETPA